MVPMLVAMDAKQTRATADKDAAIELLKKRVGELEFKLTMVSQVIAHYECCM